MPGALTVVDEGMDPPLKHGFVVGLHPFAGNIHQDRKREGGACRDVVNLRSDDGYLPVLDLLPRPHPEKFESRRPAASELNVHLLFADALSLKRRGAGHRDRDRGNRDPYTAEIHAGLHGLTGGDLDPLPVLITAVDSQDRHPENPE